MAEDRAARRGALFGALLLAALLGGYGVGWAAGGHPGVVRTAEFTVDVR